MHVVAIIHANPPHYSVLIFLLLLLLAFCISQYGRACGAQSVPCNAQPYAVRPSPHGMQVRIGRYHNVYGPRGTWRGGREKAPAALCRKAAMAVWTGGEGGWGSCREGDGCDTKSGSGGSAAAENGGLEVWGDGRQTRSFTYIDDCVEGTLRVMRSHCAEPLNIGSDTAITLNSLARLALRLAGKEGLPLRHVKGPLGVRGRCSDNRKIWQQLRWVPSIPLEEGMRETYDWIHAQVGAACLFVHLYVLVLVLVIL